MLCGASRRVDPSRLPSSLLLALLALSGPAASSVHAAPLAAWDVSGQSGFGTSPLPVTSHDADVAVGDLTRGSGVSTSGSPAGHAWGGTNWVDSSQATAITNNRVVTLTIAATGSNSVSIASLGTFDYRRSATGPDTGRLQYAIGAGAFVDGPSLSYGSSNSTGASLGPIDLSSIADLQNVPSSTTITFDALASKPVNTLPFTVSATASSGLAVSFTSTNPSVATVSGLVVTLHAQGTTNIVADQAGNADYFTAPAVSQPLTVLPPSSRVPANDSRWLVLLGAAIVSIGLLSPLRRRRA